MKFSITLAAALAPLSMARTVRNAIPPLAARGDESMLEGRALALAQGMKGRGITANAQTNVIIIWANPGGGAQTTVINEQVTVITGASPTEAPVAHPPPGEAVATPPPAGDPAATPGAPAPQASHTVKVGGPGGLTFQPDQLQQVPVGDVVVFEFLSQNHTVTQSPFDTPCDAIEGGMDSGFQGNPNNSIVPAPQVAMQVMTSDPLWFYCRQGNHCGTGMVFSINPTAAKTQAQFQALAIAQKGEGAAAPITGGAPAAPPADPAAPPAAPPAEGAPAAPPAPAPGAPGEGATPGQGVIEGGSCTCMVSCNAGGFPANGQGVGAVGGVGGSLPLNMAIR